MLTKRPLLPTRADQNLLVLDASRERVVKAAFQHRNTLMVGGVGSGKTSVLNAILASAGASGSPPLAIYLNARGATDSYQLVQQLLWRATEVGWIEQVEDPDPQDPFAMASMIRRLGDAPENAIVLIDDPSTEQLTALFGRFRDEVWQLPIWFTVAVGEQSAAAAAVPPVDAFFDSVFVLEPFSPGQAFELLKKRQHIRQIEGSVSKPSNPMQPRAILLDAETGSTGVRQDPQLQSELMQRAREAAGRAGEMLLAEIWGSGAVSASDTDLQARLGVTRSRLTQLLKELERAGALVIVDTPAGGTVGRPKVMYDINRNQ